MTGTVAGNQRRPPGAQRRSGRLAHATVPVLSILGTLLLGACTAIELSDTNARAELWTGVAAGATFLAAMALSRGSDSQLLVLRARLIVGAGLSALLAVAALWQATERTAPRVLFLLIPVFLLFTTAGLALREAGAQRRHARLRDLRSRQAGEEAERRRWARELHDDTLQELAAVHVLLGVASTATDPAANAAAIAQAREVVARQIGALRRLISRMRPLVLDSLGLRAALEDLARRTGESAGIEVEVVARDLPRLPAETETSIYRIVQECLTNAVRHSGARRVSVKARHDGRYLRVAVRDDGCGPPPDGFVQGLGLLGIRERADTLGARLVIEAADPSGTLVRLRIPWPVA